MNCLSCSSQPRNFDESPKIRRVQNFEGSVRIQFIFINKMEFKPQPFGYPSEPMRRTGKWRMARATACDRR